jgi:hypothetical protein
MVTQKYISNRLKELSAGCVPQCAKAVSDKMNFYGIVDFELVLEELIHDTDIDESKKQNNWIYVLIFKKRGGNIVLKKSLLEAVDRLVKKNTIKA